MYNYQPVSGSPLIPAKFIIIYLGILLVSAFCLSLFLSLYKPITSWPRRLKIFFLHLVTANFILLSLIVISSIYILVPKPTVVSSMAKNNIATVSVKNPIEIVFDRPIGRKNLSKSISPSVPGVWVFENPIYSTHLYRKLVFYPHITLQPDTIYTVMLSGIKNFLQISSPSQYAFSFKTQASPKIARVELADEN